MPARSKSLHARALSHGEREEARGGKTVEIYRVPLLARVRVLFIRASSFFLSSCVCFVCARLVLTTFFLLSRFQNEDIFRFSFCFLGETAQKGEMGTKKKAREVRKERGCFFLFFGGKDLSVVLPKSTQT